MAKRLGWVKGLAAVVILLEISPLVGQPVRWNSQEHGDFLIRPAESRSAGPAPSAPAGVLDTDILASLRAFQRTIATSA